ncbi:MAG: MBL fold metallo-hydrolase [Clostridia bacterium]|nr:MBL fold metallo-hydrolase [Clostridia bacterium]
MLNITLLDSPHSFAANCYMISSGGECAIIDPTVPYSPELCQGRLKYILLTHAHFDHILDIDSWVANTDAKVICSIDEKDALSDPMRNCYKLFNGSDNGFYGDAFAIENGGVLPLGDDRISLMYCPGHTIGSVTYLCDGNAFVGDTIFENGGYGRFDLPTGNFVMMRESIKRLINLPDETRVYSGHGNSTTIREYKLYL